MSDMNNPYKVLGVSPTDSDEKIDEAYNRCVRKYHPDKYENSEFRDLAEEKMKEINAAYDAIKRMRKNGEKQRYEKEDVFGNTFEEYNYADIRHNINIGNLGKAEADLNAVHEGDRAAEWHYLMGCVLIKKGYYVDAQKMINTACNMDPGNSEYRAARDRLNSRANNYGGGYQTSHARGCSGCDVCSSLLCADCCCECMGGDLIACC